MNHYFDDIFTRHNAGKPKKGARPGVRRSSTSRSIGARSDFEPSVNGDHDDPIDGHSVAPDTEERERERREADAHTAAYVSEQLSRVRSNQSADFQANSDEFEAQLDGQ
jgi:hypothetical protein